MLYAPEEGGSTGASMSANLSAKRLSAPEGCAQFIVFIVEIFGIILILKKLKEVISMV